MTDASGTVRVLREGCYYLSYDSQTESQRFLGTMRVAHSTSDVSISGDLYIAGPNAPTPGPGIPVFPLASYHHYLRVVQATFLSDLAAYELRIKQYFYDQNSKDWTFVTDFNTQLSYSPAPASFPSTQDFLSGNVTSDGEVVGVMSIGWVSPRLRRASIEFDRVDKGQFPLENVANENWKTVFEAVGWEVQAIPNQTNIPEAHGISWSKAELHAAMMQYRQPVSFDEEWRYHFLCVQQLDPTSDTDSLRGLMYEDSAEAPIPRIGIAIADNPFLAKDGPDPYFRTAIHEFGHALGLIHNPDGTGFMNTTENIKNTPPSNTPLSEKINWAFHPLDVFRLQHLPDHWVRPGGTRFAASYPSSLINAGDGIEFETGLVLSARVVHSILPLGAPARVEIEIRNTSGKALLAPKTLSLDAGFLSGKVFDPSGTSRAFSPMFRCTGGRRLAQLKRAGKVTHSVTLLRGGDGALFPGPGLYRLVFEVNWQCERTIKVLNADCNLLVTDARSSAHAKAALSVLTTPELQMTLAVGGDNFPEGNAALKVALFNSILRPHYAWIEANRLGTVYFRRHADFRLALKYLENAHVMSQSEIERALQLLKRAIKQTAGTTCKRLVKDKSASPKAIKGQRKGVQKLTGKSPQWLKIVRALLKRATESNMDAALIRKLRTMGAPNSNK